MTPARAVAMLDDQMKRHGQTITLRRGSGPGAVEASVRGVVRGYRAEQITDGITMGGSQVILSPTALAGTAFEGAGNWPRVNDKVVIAGRVRNVEAPDPILIDDVLVRLNLMVAG